MNNNNNNVRIDKNVARLSLLMQLNTQKRENTTTPLHDGISKYCWSFSGTEKYASQISILSTVVFVTPI
jgi:hypothetical protein